MPLPPRRTNISTNDVIGERPDQQAYAEHQNQTPHAPQVASTDSARTSNESVTKLPVATDDFCRLLVQLRKQHEKELLEVQERYSSQLRDYRTSDGERPCHRDEKPMDGNRPDGGSSPFRSQDFFNVDETWICISGLLSQIGEEGGITEDVEEFVNADLHRVRSSSEIAGTMTLRNRMAFCAVRPNSPFRYGWDAFGWACVTNDLLMLPVMIFPLTGFPDLPTDMSMYKSYLRLSSMYWFLHIFLSFFTGYNTPEGYCEMRPHMIVRNYIRTWFAFDVVTLLPSILEYVLLPLLPLENLTSFKILRVINLAVFFRVLRFRQLYALPRAILERWNSEYAMIVVELCKRVAMILVVYHYLACIWFGIGAIGRANPDNDTWINEFEKSRGQKLDHTSGAYVVCLHWSLVQLGIGESPVEPMNTCELMFNCFVIVASLVFVSAILSGFTDATARMRYLETQRSEQNLALRRYFQDHNISPELARRVWYCRRNMQHSLKKRVLEEDVVLLGRLPAHVHSDLRKEAFWPHLSTHPMFRRISHMDAESVTQICSSAVAELCLHGLEEFLQRDAPLTMAAFMLSGSLNQRAVDGGADTIAIRGQWACEIALWAAPQKTGNYLLAACSGCELVTVLASEFQRICKLNYFHLGFVAVYAKLAVEHFNKTSRLHTAGVLQASDLTLCREWIDGAVSTRRTQIIPVRTEDSNRLLR